MLPLLLGGCRISFLQLFTRIKTIIDYHVSEALRIFLNWPINQASTLLDTYLVIILLITEGKGIYFLTEQYQLQIALACSIVAVAFAAM